MAEEFTGPADNALPAPESKADSGNIPLLQSDRNMGTLATSDRRTISLTRMTRSDFLSAEKAPDPAKVGEALGMDAARQREFASAYEDFSRRLRSLEFDRIQLESSNPNEVTLEIPEFADVAAPLLEEWMNKLHRMLTPRESAAYWSSGAHRALFVRGFGQIAGNYSLYTFEGVTRASTGCDDDSCTFTGFEYATVPEWLLPYKP